MKDLNSSSSPLPPIAGVVQTAPTIEWHRTSDDLQLACRTWKGKVGFPVIVYLHGIEGHSQWFENTASVLNHLGMTVYAPDRRGSGLNPRDRGNLSSYKTYLADIEVFLRKVSFDHLGHSLIVLGNCWGAKAASLICQSDYKPTSGQELNLPIAGLVLCSPGIYTKIDYGMGTKFQIAYSSFVDSGRNRKWPIPLEIEMLTNNPTFQGYLKRDNLRLTEATASFFVESFKLGKLAEKASASIEMPLLVLQAGSDMIVDVDKLQGWYAKAKSTTKDLRIFPDASHTLDFDSTWFKEYAHVLSEWILAQCPVVT